MSDELIVQARSVPSDTDDSPLRHGSNQPPCTFRPCRSSRLRRFTPRYPLQVCCTLQPVIGFAVFRVTRCLRPATASEDAILVLWPRGTFPSGAIPFEAFPSFKALNALSRCECLSCRCKPFCRVPSSLRQLSFSTRSPCMLVYFRWSCPRRQLTFVPEEPA
jgi:hypothetical protein